MEETYSVLFGNDPVGKVRVTRQGLYYRFECRCVLEGAVICRLQVTCDDRQENLGVIVPVEGGFGLETRVPVKRLGQGSMQFRLLPKHEQGQGRFVPIRPEEPFAYIADLKRAFLAHQGDQIGIYTQR